MAAAAETKYTPEFIAGVIDHSLLHPTMTSKIVDEGLIQAREYGCASCCVRPCDVVRAKKALEGSKTAVCTVIGFPHGTATTANKVAEAKEAMSNGCTELDMVVNNGAAIGGEWDAVKADIQAVQDAAKEGGARVKVIFENDYHIGHEDRIIKLAQICSEVGVAWVKTSTGFGFVKGSDGKYSYQGAQLAHLRLMKEHAKGCELKAAGGVRSLEALLAVVAAGCTRVGASATKALVEEARQAIAEGKDLASMVPVGAAGDASVGGTY